MVDVLSIDRADVRVDQIEETPTVTPIVPVLKACVVGPCFQVVKGVVNGSAQSSAKTGLYENVQRTIRSLDFPDPRNNLSFLEFITEETRLFTELGATLKEMKDDERFLSGNYLTNATSIRAVGTGNKSATIEIVGGTPTPSFLTAAAAAVLTGSVDISLGANVDTDTLVFRIDRGAWITVTFDGTDPIAKVDIVAQINAAWVAAGNSGTIATAPGNFLILTSPSEGEESVVEIDATLSTAETDLGLSTTPVIGQAYPPKAGDEFYVDGVLLGKIRSIVTATKVLLDTSYIVYPNAGALNGLRWWIRAKNLPTPKASDRPTPELYKYPSATTATLKGTTDISGANALNGLTLIVSIDGVSTTVTFSGTPTGAQVLTAINMVVGYALASLSSNSLLLTSPTSGNTSHIRVGAGTANAILGLVEDDERRGVSAGDLLLAGGFYRNAATGAILSNILSSAYVQYRALRKDVTAANVDAALVNVADQTTLEEELGPLTEENPLGLAALAMLRVAQSRFISAFGVDSVSTDSQGNPDAYQAALDFLAAQDVYALAPLSHNSTVHDLFSAHVIDQSKKENSRWRVGFYPVPQLTRYPNETLATGVDANGVSAGVANLDADLTSILLDAGIADPSTLTPADGVYLMFAGDSDRYNLSGVSGVQATGNTTFGVGENTDGFYTTDAISASMLATAWSLFLRGEAITTSSGRLDQTEAAEAYQFNAARLKHRRNRTVLPPEWVMDDGEGLRIRTSNLYAAAATAAEEAILSPSQGKTNKALGGFVQIYGANDTFKETNLKVIGANNYFYVQEPIGAGNPITRWHQSTTDPTNDNTREANITTQLDMGSYILKRTLKVFIGTTNINSPNFADALNLTLDAVRGTLQSNGIWKNFTILSIAPLVGSKTKMVIKVRPELFYPVNGIDVEIYF